MIRYFGKAPYTAALIHGGPGAQNALLPLAQDLSKYTGVLAPAQTQYSIEALLTEFNEDLYSAVSRPVTLAGHAWGAWLSVLYAAQHPEIVAKLILISCAPFEARYVPQITARRLRKLATAEQALYKLVLAGFDDPRSDKDALLAQLAAFTEKTDNYELAVDPAAAHELLREDMAMYTSIWREAAALRGSGGLSACLAKIKCPVHIIHGTDDPRPLAGVTTPLDKYGVPYDRHILRQCGHTPFLEKHARDYLVDMLLDILRG